MLYPLHHCNHHTHFSISFQQQALVFRSESHSLSSSSAQHIAMSPNLMTVAIAIAILFTGASAWGKHTTSTCPASCVQTVTETVVSTALCSAVPSDTTTLVSSIFETSTRGGPYTSANASSTIPYSSVGTISSYIVESTHSSQAPHENSTVAESSTSSTSSRKSHHHHSHTQSGNVISTKASSTSSPTPLDCQPNNCYRQFLRHPQVTGFCATYTTTVNTATTGLPDYVSK